MEKWLITGGCGFIGTNLIKQLKGKAHIRVLDNLSVGTKEDLGGVCDFVEGMDASHDDGYPKPLEHPGQLIGVHRRIRPCGDPGEIISRGLTVGEILQ